MMNYWIDYNIKERLCQYSRLNYYASSCRERRTEFVNFFLIKSFWRNGERGYEIIRNRRIFSRFFPYNSNKIASHTEE